MGEAESHAYIRVKKRVGRYATPPALDHPCVAVTFGVDQEVEYHLWSDTTPEQHTALRQALLATGHLLVEGRSAGEAPSRSSREVARRHPR